MVTNNHPFTLAEQHFFEQFTHSLNPQFTIVCPKTMKNRIVHTFDKCKTQLKNYFKNSKIGRPSATTDIWTSGNNLSIMAVTLSWLDEMFDMKEIVIGFREIDGNHTGKNISKLFLEILADFELHEKVII